MKLVWTRTAYIDRKAIREYIAQDAPKAALKLDELIPNKVGSLLTRLELGRVGPVSVVREPVAHKIYALTDGTGTSCAAHC